MAQFLSAFTYQKARYVQSIYELWRSLLNLHGGESFQCIEVTPVTLSTVLSTCETTILVKTSPQLFLNLTVYPDEAAADATLEKRGAWFQKVKHLFEDTFYYEGEIATQMTGKGENLLINDLEKDALKVQMMQLSQEVGQFKEMMKAM